jgi:hypothetical protein
MPYGPIVEPAGFTGSAGERPQAMGGLGTKVEKWIGVQCEKEFTQFDRRRPFSPGVT